MKLDKVTLTVLVDSLRHDFVTKENMPFLYSIAENGVSGSLKPPPSFSLNPTWFAGLHPNESGQWGYYYSPKMSPHRIIQPLLPVADKIIVTRRLCNLIMWKLFYPYQTPALFLPLNLARYLRSNDKLPPWAPNFVPHTTLFDLLRKNGLKWLFLGPSDTDTILKRFAKNISAAYSFIWLFFSEVDHVCHTYGPNSRRTKATLRAIDSAIQTVLSKLKSMFPKVDMFVFGDHGSVECTAVADIEHMLKTLSVRPPADYLYLLGATYAAFWFKNNHSRAIIEKTLDKSRLGKILEDSELIKYKLKFNNTCYGELIWFANEGTIISPNFFNGPTTPKAMHGYLPNVKDNWSAFVLSSSALNGESIKLQTPFELVDVFPTLLDLLNLETSERNKGKSILEVIKK
jgi:predicted AlkP superfamily pyrophosphatase or phosphodiesterase